MTNQPSRRLTPPDDTQPIRSQADLERHWRLLMGPLGFSSRQLWLNVLDSGSRATPFLSQVEALADSPDIELVEKIMELSRQLIEAHAPGGSLAMLLARPGPDLRTAADITWAEALDASAERNQVPLRPVYLASSTDIRIISPDDRLSASA